MRTESIVTVATLNLLNDLRYWDERAPLIIDELRALQPDLIALQEVALPDNNARWIAEHLDGYQLLTRTKTGRLHTHEGLAILSRLPIDAYDSLLLGDQDRVALRVTVRQAGQPLHFANTHLHWNPVNDRVRTLETRRLIDWLPGPAVLCGDFNAEPHYRSIMEMRQRFHSAHHVAHGREPDYTCPTPLFRGPGPRHAARRAALRLAGWLALGRNTAWRGVLDYIFVDQTVEVVNCRVAFHLPAPHDPHLYPSDHLGLFARLRWQSKDQ